MILYTLKFTPYFTLPYLSDLHILTLSWSLVSVFPPPHGFPTPTSPPWGTEHSDALLPSSGTHCLQNQKVRLSPSLQGQIQNSSVQNFSSQLVIFSAVLFLCCYIFWYSNVFIYACFSILMFLCMFGHFLVFICMRCLYPLFGVLECQKGAHI